MSGGEGGIVVAAWRAGPGAGSIPARLFKFVGLWFVFAFTKIFRSGCLEEGCYLCRYRFICASRFRSYSGLDSAHVCVGGFSLKEPKFYLQKPTQVISIWQRENCRLRRGDESSMHSPSPGTSMYPWKASFAFRL